MVLQWAKPHHQPLHGESMEHQTLTLAQAKTKAEYMLRLKNNPTKTEQYLSNILIRKDNKYGKWLSQVIICGYIVDFYSPKSGLIVEVDGSIHDNIKQKKHDEKRDRILTNHHYAVLRFKNEEVLNHAARVIDTINKARIDRRKYNKFWHNEKLKYEQNIRKHRKRKCRYSFVQEGSTITIQRMRGKRRIKYYVTSDPLSHQTFSQTV